MGREARGRRVVAPSTTRGDARDPLNPQTHKHETQAHGDAAGSGDALAFNEMGNVISVGDGVARASTASTPSRREMVELACGLRGWLST